MKQSTARELPWPILIAALAVIVIAAALFLVSRARSTRQAVAPPTRPAPTAPAARPSAPAVRIATPIARPAATAVPRPTAMPTAKPEPTSAPPPATSVPTPAPAAGGEPQPLVVSAFRQGPDEVLLAVTFSAPLPDKTKLKVEVGSAQQKLVKRQTVAPSDRVDLGENICAFELEPARKARFEPGQSVSVLLWVGDAAPRRFSVVVIEGWYEDVRGVRLVGE